MIIGLSGYAGAGKSTAAAELIRMGFARHKFAKPLKLMMEGLLVAQGVDMRVIRRMLEGDLKELPTDYLNGKSPRHAMQTLGTDWGRALICEQLWCDAAMRDVTGHTVFDDCRFQNEFDIIRANGGRVFEIRRPGVGPINGHVSEQPPLSDRVIMNTGSPDELALAVWDIVKTTQSVA